MVFLPGQPDRDREKPALIRGTVKIGAGRRRAGHAFVLLSPIPIYPVKIQKRKYLIHAPAQRRPHYCRQISPAPPLFQVTALHNTLTTLFELLAAQNPWWSSHPFG